ncbi:hypothetical protein B9Z55_021867 [Caenorhabditis nigoni]|uniref:BTB domain-containing protein n=1 Tax=Caenorhabditis nigoni TaxID=1611254 RepID=A0A2G5TU09_9PELO|nr:hypothetical protein B9Z55_021867 [Caenorhabditis nigoni]
MSVIPRFEKEFVLKHVFKDVPSFKEEVQYFSKWEDHFNVNWFMCLERHSDHLMLCVHCRPLAPPTKWSIQTKLELKFIGRNQKHFIVPMDSYYERDGGVGSRFLGCEGMEKEYVVDGNLTVEAKVTIVETTGLGKEKIRGFDESQKDISDVILVVSDTKFYLSKMYLAAQSSFFKSLFFGNSPDSVFSNAILTDSPLESKKPEVTLEGVDSNDVHYFMEVLYGESAIDDGNVEGVLLLADKYDAPTVKRRCVEFLLEKSKKPLKTKQLLANRYHLENWNFTCAISNANTKTKQFKLKHAFKDVTSFEEGVYNRSKREDHFNVKWSMSVKRFNNHLTFFVYCEPLGPSDKWSIQTIAEVKVVGRNQNDTIKTIDHFHERKGGLGFDILEWEEMENEYLVDGNLTVEAKVTIIETTGLGKEKIRIFDESQKDVSDVILVVRDTKFYVSKSFLAAESIFFKAILSENSSESKESKVTLDGVDPNDFHYFLEVLYGETSIDDSTVEGILMTAVKYSTPIVFRKCEEFLLNSSEMIPRKKLKLSVKYDLEELKNKCMSEAKIKSILSHGVYGIGLSIMS